ncbi:MULTISPECIES: hypothetical protein [Caballeronia]|uniref:Uncharacterized protein n=1 Tax=Caballeronia zhejiangensis TaxID=871203 RepID=A0A656QR08_9BURK|nr:MULTISPECIES: hypothetical protein [Caballeronia]EKS70808.1 hypothetical protein BURK_012858 [Burkholderia sp. SJ98]KDR34259.1 hypothetical protein BG60_01430 [Caballeronia zhejiangensis]MCG7403776.1 hypothetical protein [Caballeronia zhejiangensis]MCI1044760.1 hypothetical protein [Caballeronia zhejiangensis]MDR5766892.1 hypothetical protein [Caballeronia sp. LZ028]
MVQERDNNYITAHFIEQEIEHLARMIRSRHWHRSAAWPVSYWRERIEELQHAPAIAPLQRMELESLLNELERIAAKLESSANYGGRAQGQTRTMRDA